MKVGPKEQQTRMLGPSEIERAYGGEPKAGYTERKPATKEAVRLSNAIQSNTPVQSNAKFDKKAYQRELMRKRRAAAKAK